MVEAYSARCRRAPTAAERKQITQLPGFEDMTTFVITTERIENKGPRYRQPTGDSRRALTMKANFLMENVICRK